MKTSLKNLASLSNETLFATAFSTSPIGIAIVSLDGHFVRVNPSLCKIVGYEEKDLTQTTFQAITHPEDLDEDLHMLAELIAGKRSTYQLEKRYRSKSGKYIWIILNVSIIRDKADRPLYFISQIQDMTRLKLADAKRNRFFTLSLELMAITDFSNHFLHMNSAWQQILGWSPSDLLSRSMEDFLHPEDIATLNTKKTALAEGSTLVEVELRFRAKNNSYRWLCWRALGLPEEERIYGVARDMTTHKKVEEALKEARNHAEAAARSKSEFLALMSHEIRTPMNATIGFTELLEHTPLNNEQLSFVSSIKRSSLDLLHLINRILDFSKLEAGLYQVCSAPFQPLELIGELEKLFYPLAHKKNLILKVNLSRDFPEWIDSDATMIRQILSNLIDNAIKFTDSGTVEVYGRCVGGSDQPAIEIVVADTGIGLQSEFLSRIFLPFEQSSQPKHRRNEGTGLGMAIAQQLTKCLNGMLTAKIREDGNGSLFTFTFPYTKANPIKFTKPSSPSVRTPSTLKSPILVAEDNLVNQRLMTFLLKHLGYTCHMVSNGKQVLEALEKSFYPIILMDIQMPEMDGLKATQEIRQREASAQLHSRHYIIGQSAYGTPVVSDVTMGDQMDAHLTKPITIDALAEALNKAMEVIR